MKVTDGLAAQEPSVMFNLCKLVQIGIDGDSPANRSPKQNLLTIEIQIIEMKPILLINSANL